MSALRNLPLLPILVGTIAVVTFVLVVRTRFDGDSRSAENGSKVPGTGVDATTPLANSPAGGPPEEWVAFSRWLVEFRSTPEEERNGRLLEEGRDLAKTRFEMMRRLIREDPKTALARALSFAEFRSVPEELRSFVEEPFSTRAEVDVLPRCFRAPENFGPALPASQSMDLRIHTEFGSFDAFTYGRRLEIPSRAATPLQGIRLDGLAALRPPVFHLVPEHDVSVLEERFPPANPDPDRGFWTGRILTPSRVVAVSGGRLFYFADRETFAAFEARASRLEEAIGENLGANLIFESLAATIHGAEDGFDLKAVEEKSEKAQIAALKAARKVLLIRVDFSDKTGSPIGVSTLQDRMDGEVNDQCRDMSFGKVTLTNTVETQLIRLPRPSTYYNGSDDGGGKKNSDLYNDALAAAQTAGVDTSGYHTRCIVFKQIGMGYCGLATVGGGKIWLPCHGSKVIVHELGHNFGVGHASFHDPDDDNDPLGSGTSSEYGDNTDIMGGGGVPAGHFHPQFKTKLGWLESSQRHDFGSGSTNNTWRIYRFDHPDTDPGYTKRAVRVYRDANGEYLWIGHRRRFSYQNYDKGAQLYWQKAGKNKSWLIDVTPGGGKNNSGLAIGRTFSDTRKDLHITALKRGGSSPDEWLEVQVRRGPFAGNGIPAITSFHFPSRVPVNQAVEVGVTANDPDGDVLAYYFDFGDDKVIGNDGTIAGRSYTWTSKGTRAITITVSDRKGEMTSETVSVTVQDSLPAPGGLSASDATVPGIVRLDWNAVSGATGYEIYRSESGSAATAEPIGSTSDPGFDDLTTKADRVYHYWVQALGSNSASRFSDSDTGSSRNAAPQLDLQSSSRVRVFWDEVPGAESFRIYRGSSEDSALAEELGETVANSFDDTSAVPGQLQFWFLRVVSGGTAGSFSAPAPGRRIFAPPGGFFAELTPNNGILLDWMEVEGQVGEYEVWRSLEGDVASAELFYRGGLTRIVDGTATKGKDLFYWTRAMAESATGEWSLPVTGSRMVETFAEYTDRFDLGDIAGAATRDTDFDGRSDLAEWARGRSDPTSRDSVPVRLLRVQTIGGEDYVTVNFHCLRGSRMEAEDYRHLFAVYRGRMGRVPGDWSLTPMAVTPPADLAAPPDGYQWGSLAFPLEAKEMDHGFFDLEVRFPE